MVSELTSIASMRPRPNGRGKGDRGEGYVVGLRLQ
jgi:hypothetical protein